MSKNNTKGLKKAASEVVASGDCYTSDNSGLAPPFTVKNNSQQYNMIDTTAQTVTLDDSFQEVTTKRSRREDKQIAKEKMQEDKVTKKLTTTTFYSAKQAEPELENTETE